jgi:hypothetical protein
VIRLHYPWCEHILTHALATWKFLSATAAKPDPSIIWADVIQKFAGTVFAITGNKDSMLAKKADLKIILERRSKTQHSTTFLHTRSFCS